MNECQIIFLGFDTIFYIIGMNYESSSIALIIMIFLTILCFALAEPQIGIIHFICSIPMIIFFFITEKKKEYYYIVIFANIISITFCIIFISNESSVICLISNSFIFVLTINHIYLSLATAVIVLILISLKDFDLNFDLLAFSKLAFLFLSSIWKTPFTRFPKTSLFIIIAFYIGVSVPLII